MLRRIFVLCLISCLPSWTAEIHGPVKPDSLRFGVIGDTGTGGRPAYEIGAELAKARTTFPFDFVVMLGDNLYGGQKPKDFRDKFELPYKALLDGGVKFYAALVIMTIPTNVSTSSSIWAARNITASSPAMESVSLRWTATTWTGR